MCWVGRSISYRPQPTRAWLGGQEARIRNAAQAGTAPAQRLGRARPAIGRAQCHSPARPGIGAGRRPPGPGTVPGRVFKLFFCISTYKHLGTYRYVACVLGGTLDFLPPPADAAWLGAREARMRNVAQPGRALAQRLCRSRPGVGRAQCHAPARPGIGAGRRPPGTLPGRVFQFFSFSSFSSFLSPFLFFCVSLVFHLFFFPSVIFLSSTHPRTNI